MRLLAVVLALLVAAPALAEAGAHADPVAPVVLALALFLIAARVGGELAVRLGQPAVLGELGIGLALGALSRARIIPHLEDDATVDILARLGVLLLLFEVGLESTVQQMRKVGVTALAVATVGVVVPVVLGVVVGLVLLPHASAATHVFLGATLAATSVGITARVLKDLGVAQTPTARIILGAAVIDDVLGLVLLAVVTGAIAALDAGAPVSALSIGLVVVKAVVFLAGALFVGQLVARRAFSWLLASKVPGALLATALVFCFLLSWMANAVGLAPIIGAFAAGLLLEHAHEAPYVARGEHGLDVQVRPLAAAFVPLFFVVTGMRCDLAVFLDGRVLLLAAALTVVAIVGKQACALVARAPGVDGRTVGIGMIPRGEVGLIFAGIGASTTLRGAPVLPPAVFSALVVMTIITTMVTPPALKWSLRRAVA